MSNVDQIKERLSIVEVVESYIKLEKAGRYYRATCPFHSEKTPSFVVTPERGRYHCFGCGQGGDIFTFVQEMEHVDFYEALKTLATKAGVTLDSSSENQDNRKKKRLYELMDLATKFYEVQFRKNKAAVTYMLDRGVHKETLTSFRIGFAPHAWSELYEAMRGHKFSDEELEASGLCIRGDKGTYYDRFRNRIMFPIADAQGRIVAFSGRLFVDKNSLDSDTRAAKYVNSPEGVLYHKSSVLYGYDRAKRAMMVEDKVVVVEGQMDLVMAHQAGITWAVALSGTALTNEQLGLIGRFTKNIVLALDGDTAGVAAAVKSTKLAYDKEMSIQVVTMPEGSDPADIVQSDPEELGNVLAKAEDFVTFRLHSLLGQIQGHQEKAIKEDLYPFVIAMRNTIAQDRALQEIAKQLAVSPDAIRKDFITYSKNAAKPMTMHASAPMDREQAERAIDMILGIILWQQEITEGQIDPGELANWFQDIIKVPVQQYLEAMSENEETRLALQASMRYEGKEKTVIEAEFKELLRHHALRLRKTEYKEHIAKLRLVEQKGHQKEIDSLLEQGQRILLEIDTIERTMRSES